MTDTTDYIALLIDDLLSLGATGSTNNDIYQPRLDAPEPGGTEPTDWPPAPFTYRPRCMYFYYVRFDRDGALRVDHYFYPHGGPLDDPSQWQPIRDDEIEGIVAKLALNGRPTTPKNPPKLPDHNFENVVWDRISYIAIFVDEANWKLHKLPGKITPQGAIAFNPLKGSRPNSSFFDAKDFEIDMPTSRGGGDKRSAICFINHMTIEHIDGSIGSELGESDYIFDVYFDVAFADPTVRTAAIILDPGGTNMGPAQKP